MTLSDDNTIATTSCTTPASIEPPLSLSSSSSSSYVLYVDHQGHPAPLDESYHATASRRLSSSLNNRGFPSTLNSVDSAYCPQCLTVYTEIGPGAIHANSVGYFCSKPACKLCPICISIVSIQLLEGISATNTTNTTTEDDKDGSVIIVYACGHCGWTSDECNVRVPFSAITTDASSDPTLSSTPETRAKSAKISLDSFGRLEMARAANDLLSELSSKKRNSNEVLDQYWNQLTNAWNEEKIRVGQRGRGGNSSGLSLLLLQSASLSQRRLGGGIGSRARIPTITTGSTGTVSTTSSVAGRTLKEQRQQRKKKEEWSLETLEETLAEKKKLMLLSYENIIGGEGQVDPATDPSIPRKGLQVQRVLSKNLPSSIVHDATVAVTDDGVHEPLIKDVSFFAYQQQVLNIPFIDPVETTATETTMTISKYATKSSYLLPLLIPLRLRTSRRCRMELSEGRPGILLKPKLNPLEGDSSLRTGQGQWYKKDCSAIAIIPRVDIIHKIYHNSNPKSSLTMAPSTTTTEITLEREEKTLGTVIVFLLKVSNPTLGTVRLRFGPSKYTGERRLFSFPSKENSNNESNDNNISTTSELHDLVVGTITLGIPVIINAVLHGTPLENLPTSETVELLSAEDSIIELGAVRARETPSQVLEWKYDKSEVQSNNDVNKRDTVATNPSTVDGTPESPESSIRLVAQSASDAWFELAVVCDPATTPQNISVLNEQLPSSSRATASSNSSHRRLAFPIALQVDLGNGSWESSLIPPDTTKQDDHVTFDLILIC